MRRTCSLVDPASQAPLLATLEAEVALLRGEARALRECSPEKLQELVSLLEQALNAARAAQVQVGLWDGGARQMSGPPSCR